MFEVIIPERKSNMTMKHRHSMCAYITNRMLYVNARGMEAIKLPSHIRIGIDTKMHRIIIIPSSRTDTHAYKVQSVHESRNGGRVENYDLMLSLLKKGLPLDSLGHHYQCYTMMDDSILWFDYNKPYETNIQQLSMFDRGE